MAQNPNTAGYSNPSKYPPFPNLTNVAPSGRSASARCLFYFVNLDEENRPIPGTMFAKNNNQIPGGCAAKIARLTGEVMIPPNGQVQCFPRNGLRYWYQIKSIPTGGGSARSEIVPNSMIAVKGVPKGPAGRSCQFIEYKIFKVQDGL